MSQLWMGDILPKLARSDRLRAFSVGFGLLLLGVLCALSYANLQSEMGAHRVIRGAQETINELGNLSNAIDDAESAQRGYLLTGDKSFLQTYNETVDDVATASSRLRSLWADDAPQTARLKEFEGLLQERLQLLAENLAYRTASGLAIPDSSRLLRGQKLMEEIDQSIFAMLESERQQVTRTTEEVASRDRALADLLLAGVILSLGFIVPSYLLVNREAKRRRTAEALLRTANADLENRIASRTAQLHRSEGQLRLFIDGAPAAIAMFDREMRYLATSRRFVEDYRLNGQDLIGRSHYDVFPEISARWRDVHRRCLAGAVESSEEESFPRADGQIDWIKWEIRPWYEEQGSIGGVILFSENITERKQAEEHRRHSDALYRQVVELCLEAIWVHKAGRILFANEAAARLFGFGQPADLVGRSNFELVHPDDRERAMKRTSAMTGSRNAAPLTEMKFLGENGRPIVLQVRASPFLHKGEVAIMAVGRDLTERIEAAGVLRESEARFQALANTLPGPMWMSNEEGECIFVNNSWLKYTGRPLEEELGQGFADNIHPDQRVATMALEPAMIHNREPVNTEYQLRNKDGRYRWFVDYAVPRFSDDGRYLGHVGVLIDVDDRRLLEAKMKTIVESTVDGIITINQSGTILTFSGSAERIFGYKEHEVTGQNVSMLMPDPDRSRHNSYIHNYLNTGIAKIIGIGREVRGLRKDGSVFPMDLAVGELRTTDKEREFVGTVRDISARRQLEDQLRQTQKIEAVGQLTGGIAHDFNNLLGVVIGNLDHVLEHVDGESETGKMIHSALSGALHGAELTHRLLAFARQQQLEPKGFSINEMLPDITAILKRTLGEAIAIRISPGEDLWPAFADPSQVQDAILNLAINARDAMPEGGTLTIETANIQLDETYCKDNPEAKPGDYAMLAISDTGMGMSSEVVARAFEPFFTTKPMGKGTGLGLSMIYGFARQSGGHLKLYSEVGLGTSVKLYLPRADDAKATGKSIAAKEQAAPRGSEVILVAEDNADLRQMAVAQLSGLGYRILEAQNGEEALAVLMGEAQIDLLFSDIVMSGKLTGHGLARQARKYRPGLKVLLTTGYAEKAATAEDGDGEHVLRKPYRKRDLAVRVRTILDQSCVPIVNRDEPEP